MMPKGIPNPGRCKTLNPNPTLAPETKHPKPLNPNTYSCFTKGSRFSAVGLTNDHKCNAAAELRLIRVRGSVYCREVVFILRLLEWVLMI